MPTVEQTVHHVISNASSRPRQSFRIHRQCRIVRLGEIVNAKHCSIQCSANKFVIKIFYFRNGHRALLNTTAIVSHCKIFWQHTLKCCGLFPKVSTQTANKAVIVTIKKVTWAFSRRNYNACSQCTQFTTDLIYNRKHVDVWCDLNIFWRMQSFQKWHTDI